MRDEWYIIYIWDYFNKANDKKYLTTEARH